MAAGLRPRRRAGIRPWYLVADLISDDGLLRMGGWNPNAAKIIFSHFENKFGLVLVDVNGNDQLLCLDRIARGDTDLWRVLSTDEDVQPYGGSGWTPDFVYIWGTENNAKFAKVRYGKITTNVPVINNRWFFVQETSPLVGDMLVPTRI